MKVVKISKLDWNINCPHCGEYMSSSDIADVEDAEVLTCGACRRKAKVHLTEVG